jgi:hypothetical protein
MSLSVSSFPGAHSNLTTNPTWGKAPSPTSKRWFFGGRLNTGSASFMKGIRHIGKIQLKSSVARFAQKQSSQTSRPPPPPRLTVSASTIVIDVLAVPHDDGCQPSADMSHDAPVPDPTSRPRWRGAPLLARIARPRAISSGAGGAASRAAQQARTRVDSEGAKATSGGTTSPGPSWERNIKEMGPVPDLPVVTLTPADGDDRDSPSPERKNELSGGNSAPLWRETRTPVLRRSMSSPSFMHAGSRERSPPPPSPLPLRSAQIARLRSGSRPTTPFLVTGRRPKTAPTTPTIKPLSPPALLLASRTPTGPHSTRDGQGSIGSPSYLPRSRSQPQLRTVAILASAKRSAGSPPADSTRSCAGSPSPTLALAEGTPDYLQQPPGSASPAASTCVSAEMPEARQEAPPVPALPQGGEGACREHIPRTAPDPGYVAWPMSLGIVMDPRAVREMYDTGAAMARHQATRRR